MIGVVIVVQIYIYPNLIGKINTCYYGYVCAKVHTDTDVKKMLNERFTGRLSL